jgi:hypothetical protein
MDPKLYRRQSGHGIGRRCREHGSRVPIRRIDYATEEGLEGTVPFVFAVARNLSKSFQFLEVAHRQGSVSSWDEIRDPTVELLAFTPDSKVAFVWTNATRWIAIRRPAF